MTSSLIKLHVCKRLSNTFHNTLSRHIHWKMSESESENETYFDSDSSEDPEGVYGNEPEYSAAELALMADNEAEVLHRSHNIKSSSCS